MSKTQYPSTVYVVYHAPGGTEDPYYLVFADKEEAIEDAVDNEVDVGVYTLKTINRPIVSRKFAGD